jgi:pyridoxine 4-dehydrogenase
VIPAICDTAMAASPVSQSGTYDIAGDLRIDRLGFGTMQLTGDGVWGPPDDRDEAIRVLRIAARRGVTFFDTADSYGPFVAEQLLHDALSPYPEEIVIATKAGFTRQGPQRWTALGRPDYLRQQVELSLRHLQLERIDLLQLHCVDPHVPIGDSLGELVALQGEGKIRHIGLSEVSVDQLLEAQRTATITTVQNRYNVADRTAEPVLDHCDEHSIGFIPWFPLATGELARRGGPLQGLADEIGATPAQLALAWLLKRSRVMLPIPGTSTVAHLEENLGAAGVRLTGAQCDAIAHAAGGDSVAT